MFRWEKKGMSWWRVEGVRGGGANWGAFDR